MPSKQNIVFLQTKEGTTIDLWTARFKALKIGLESGLLEKEVSIVVSVRLGRLVKKGKVLPGSRLVVCSNTTS